jgi:hypothetical protein
MSNKGLTQADSGSNGLPCRFRGDRGVALMEALIALAVVVAAAAALFGIHSYVMGSSSESRLETAAMGLAQEKLEELRTEQFAAVYPDDPDTASGQEGPIVFDNPGIVRSLSVGLTRCWAIERVLPADVSENASLVRVSVNVVRSGSACNPTAGDGLASLVTLLARQDPRTAAREYVERLSADGDGRLVPHYTPDPDNTVAPLPSGFEEERDGDDRLVAIINPDTGQAMVPRDDGELRYATINGNILFDGIRSAADVGLLRLRPEGVAMCRLYYPGFPAEDPEDVPPAPPVFRAALDSIPALSYAQYSCVVADQWRREILLSPRLEERVCVGHPGLLEDDPGLEEDAVARDGPLFVRTQRIIGGRRFYLARQYTGYGWQRDTEGDPVEVDDEFVRLAVGIRGASDDSSVLGSLCTEGMPCWNDDELKALVPGGHQMLVMAVDNNFNTELATNPEYGNELCAEKMALLEEIDGIDEVGEDRDFFYANTLKLNLGNLYCTNEKDYTVALAGEPGPGDCLSYTRVSGFLLKDAGVTAWDGAEVDVTLAPANAVDVYCHAMGRFDEKGGAYMCLVPEDAGAATVVVSATGLTQSPADHAGLNPLLWPHDIVLKNFSFTVELP